MLERSFQVARVVSGAVLAGIILGVPLAGTGYGQSEHKKVPVVDKLTTAASHQAFDGTVQSINKKQKILNVNTMEGGNTEIFPLRSGIRIETVAGEKRSLDSLTPGTNVMVYFDQKNGERKVTKIEVLLPPVPARHVKKPSPPS